MLTRGRVSPCDAMMVKMSETPKHFISLLFHYDFHKIGNIYRVHLLVAIHITNYCCLECFFFTIGVPDAVFTYEQ